MDGIEIFDLWNLYDAVASSHGDLEQLFRADAFSYSNGDDMYIMFLAKK